MKAAAATLACRHADRRPARAAGRRDLGRARQRPHPLLESRCPGMPVIAEGSGVRLRVLTDRRGVAHLAVTPSAVGLVHFRRVRPHQAGLDLSHLARRPRLAQNVGHRLTERYGSRSMTSRAAPAARARARPNPRRARRWETWPRRSGVGSCRGTAARRRSLVRVGARLQDEASEEGSAEEPACT